MQQSVRNLLLVVTLASVAASGTVAIPNHASAYHDYDTRLLDGTADSLHRREFRLGLFKLSYGVFDFFQISTYTAPWILGAVFEDVAPNIEFKSTFYQGKRLSLAAGIGFITGTVEQVVDVEASRFRYFMTPVSLTSSVRFNTWTSLHIGGIYTATQGDANSGLGSNDLDGSAVIDLLQLWVMTEWRLSKVVAFTFSLRWVPWVSDTIVRGSVQGDQGNPDVGVQVQIEFVDLKNAFAVVPGFAFSWKRANLKIGLGYGDLFTNFLGFPLAVPGDFISRLSPEFDVFVRF